MKRGRGAGCMVCLYNGYGRDPPLVCLETRSRSDQQSLRKKPSGHPAPCEPHDPVIIHTLNLEGRV